MKKKIAILTAICLLCITLFQTISLAWMSDNGMSSPIDITSNVHKAYFESGDGTKEIKYDESGDIIAGPFEIAHPVQLYYFAWLQYLGFLNVDNDEDGITDTIYFRVSADLDMNDIDENGEQVQYVLPPIGTRNHPFLGNFDGEGHTITDLIVENIYDSMFEAPSGTDKDTFGGAEIIGFFGVVGELKTGDYRYESQANEVKNVVLENLTVKTQTNNALIGLVAGYVNGTVDCVGVVGSKIDIKSGTTTLSYTNNLSDYSLIGYCTPAYKNEIYLLNTSLTNPDITAAYTVVPDKTAGGNAQGWGGSVKMSDIYSWLRTINDNRATSSNNNYTLERTDFVAVNGTTITLDRSRTTKKSYTVNDFGSFVFTNSSPNYVNFISGAQKVTQHRYDYSNEDVTVYYIKDRDYYLCFNGNTIYSTQDEAQATKWYASNGANGGVVSTVVDGRVYYLTIANGNISTILDIDADMDNLPEWDFSGDHCSMAGATIECDEGNWQIAVGSGSYKISIKYNNNTTYYLDCDGTEVARSTSEANAAVWYLTATNNGYTISTFINNVPYYLGYTNLNSGSSNRLNLTTSPTTWQYDGTYIYVVSGSTTFYLRYSNSNSIFVVQNYDTYRDIILTPVTGSNSNTEAETDLVSSNSTQKKVVYSQATCVDNSLKNGYYDDNGNRVEGNVAGITYFPLSTTVKMGSNANSDSFLIDATNTGYIIGAEYGINNGTTSEHDEYGNIRIARYDTGSMTNSTTPYTMTYKTNNKFQTITNRESSTLNNLGLQKYADCYQDYIDSIASGCCGIHFMQASVSTENMTRITAHLNGETIPNYQVPTNCIDFNLYERGFINFVAGSYFTAQTPQNNSFFSIYEIIRNPNDATSIKEIKEISKIYALLNSHGDIDTSKPYYYAYTDGTTNGTIPSNYTEVFDCKWITHPNDSKYYGAGGNNPSAWANNRAFYFEVPVNAGEYAIGSTEGRTGAYLTYLDLAANAQLVERVKQYEEIIEKQAESSIPNGVEMLAPSEKNDTDSIDSSNSAFVSINAGTSGAISFNKTENGEITQSATSGITAEYISVDTVLKDGNGNTMSVPISQTTKIERTTYRDYNLTTGDSTVTTITKTTVTKNGTTTITYSKKVVVTDVEGNVTETITEPQADQLFPNTVDPDTSPTTSTGKKLLNLAFAYGQDTAVKVTYLYIPAGQDENGNATAPTYLITINNPGPATTLKATLTTEGVASGITFIITDGTNSTTLLTNTQAQKVTISTSP